MKNGVVGALVVVLGVSGAVGPRLVVAKGGGKAGGTSVLLPAGAVEFADVPDMKGVQMATLEGDPAKGPSQFMLKFVAGFEAPMHHHTANHSGTVVAGTLILGVAGQERRLPAGSFFAFSGKAPHATKCKAGPDCVVSMNARGKWDVVPEKTLAAK